MTEEPRDLLLFPGAFVVALSLRDGRPFRCRIRLSSGERRTFSSEEAPRASDPGRLVESVFRGEAAYCGPLPPDLTDFERQVLEETRRIPFGETRTYGTLAERIGRPGSSRAVGRALGKNPLPLLIPCHRVVGKDGKMTGYSGGVAVKEALLAWERASIAP